MVPWPTATQCVSSAHDTASRGLPIAGMLWLFHDCPAFALVATTALPPESAPTATHCPIDGQVTALKDPPGIEPPGIGIEGA